MEEIVLILGVGIIIMAGYIAMEKFSDYMAENQQDDDIEYLEKEEGQ